MDEYTRAEINSFLIGLITGVTGVSTGILLIYCNHWTTTITVLAGAGLLVAYLNNIWTRSRNQENTDESER